MRISTPSLYQYTYCFHSRQECLKSLPNSQETFCKTPFPAPCTCGHSHFVHFPVLMGFLNHTRVVKKSGLFVDRSRLHYMNAPLMAFLDITFKYLRFQKIIVVKDSLICYLRRAQNVIQNTLHLFCSRIVECIIIVVLFTFTLLQMHPVSQIPYSI